MKTTAFILLFAILGGCASHSPALTSDANPTTQSSQGEIVGTWRWDSVTDGATGKQEQVPRPFFLRFYPDGTAISWPTPSGDISHGVYRIKNNQLFLADTKTSIPFAVTADQLWYIGDDGTKCSYHRIVPDLEPGQLN